MPANRDRVIRSPRLAAMGVATLSGLMPTFLDAMITPIMMSPAEWRGHIFIRVSSWMNSCVWAPIGCSLQTWVLLLIVDHSTRTGVETTGHHLYAAQINHIQSLMWDRQEVVSRFFKNIYIHQDPQLWKIIYWLVAGINWCWTHESNTVVSLIANSSRSTPVDVVRICRYEKQFSLLKLIEI